jgi:hypothetical protein
MGLDQYAYAAAKAGAQDKYYEDENYDKDDSDPTKIGPPREIAYWRKHPNLQGWMERLWVERNPGADGETGDMFNGIELELTWEDLERLELDVIAGTLPATSGFFFGSDSDEHYREQDLSFVKNAKAELFMGLKVFYNSSW